MVYRTEDTRQMGHGISRVMLPTEVIDNEVHVVDEALKHILTIEPSPLHVVICIDNIAAASLLENLTSCSEYAHAGQQKAIDLSNKGTTISTRWIPAHIDIHGNERADELAKNGTENVDHPCPGSEDDEVVSQGRNNEARGTIIVRPPLRAA
jgi:hypothetical protein